MRKTGRGIGKVLYYAGNFVQYYLPVECQRRRLRTLLASATPREWEEARKRMEYYNRMPACEPADSWKEIGSLRYPYGQKKKFSTYFFDILDCVRCFDPRSKIAYEFGDVTEVPPMPTFVKSRPIDCGRESNSVVLKLDKFRHFQFVNDKTPFTEKRDMLVSRNVVRQPHRRLLLEMYSGHPLCNIGQINADTAQGHPEWLKGRLSLAEQLRYKFVSCIEGNDVATNLKWVMSSNSLAVMPRPKYETWYMEGTLLPDYHYVEIRPDYSDLPEKLRYYITHTDEAEAIIGHAHEYVRQFTDKRVERLVSLLVVRRYLERSGQACGTLL
ncbi:MAG: lipopolysaccharide A protein [Prevotellaceae bacterium]|nr:lipopolysaccharide A protein [Prevotellaceae bacterium]